MKKEKLRAKEAPKARIIILPILMAVIILSAVFASSLPLWACILLGIFNADLVYFLFVVLKIHRIVMERFCVDMETERLAHQDAAAYAREIAAEGIVLLKNEEAVLPLAKGTHLNLFGLRCVQMNYNGGGSAASDESKCVSLEQGLREAGFLLNQDLLNLSYNYLKNGKYSVASPGENYRVKSRNEQKGGAEFVSKPGSPLKAEIPVEALRNTDICPDGQSVMDHAKQFGDIALIVLSRGGGEGYDFDPKDLRITESERQLLNEVCGQFSCVILILNMANVMEMGWLSGYPSVKGVLWTGFPGTSGNLALGDILNGTVNPSGRLPDTWAADCFSAPAAHNFCELQEDGSWNSESFHYSNAPDKKGYFVHYREGIYVGYRYYEMRADVDQTYSYEKEVVWPFGFGRCYTDFKQEIRTLQTKTASEEQEIVLQVFVKNVGNAAGKEVVQVYSNPPYTGRIEKSTANLVGFSKTDILAPGESVIIPVSIPKRELASFDVHSGKWILEKGEYRLSVRSDSHHILDETVWMLETETVFEGTKALSADADIDSLTRNFPENHRAFTGPSREDYQADNAVLQALNFHVPTDEELGLSGRDMPPTARHAGLKLKDMAGVAKEDPLWDTFVQQLTVGELCHLCGNGAWQTAAVPRLGVPRTVIPDGSTSMASTIFSTLVMGKRKAGITWPCPPILVASFNRRLAWLEGEGVGREANAMGYGGWYAPSMNCHRTPFNSRNFEYYSEDGFLAGKMASGVVSGVQSHRVNVFIKHFAMNERETNARNQLFTWCSEQAMREIYLKPFEMAVQEGGARGIMSSFNYIGHTWAGGHKGLMTELLKKEWGFKGCVVTDACLYPHMDVVQMVYAGGDLSLDTLGGFTGGNIKRRNLLAMAQSPKRKVAMRRWMQDSAKDILYAVCQIVT